VNNRDSFVFKTADYGRTWKSISGDLPRGVHSYAHCVREDSVKRGLLYLGTENALYFSPDDGQHWLPLQSGLPHAPVHWLTIQEHFNDLVVATYGRGFWILDDITPLRTLTPEVMNEDVHLFAQRPAYRFRNITEMMTMPDDATEGHNAPYGADINFFLKAAPRDEERDGIKITISDAAGKTVRTLEVGKTARAGVNRVWWDLRVDPTDEIKLRTSPLHAPEFKLAADGTRKFPTAGLLSVLVPPGTYTVALTAAGVRRVESLVVRKDPNTEGSEADVTAQTAMMVEIRNNMNATAKMISDAESIRSQIAAWKTVVGESESVNALRAAADVLDARIVAVESRLFNMTATGRGQDQLRTPGQMVEKLAHLADVVSYADFAPTDSQREVHAKIGQDLERLQEQMSGLVLRELATFNAALRERQIGAIVVPHR
jgi:hypothetical protein